MPYNGSTDKLRKNKSILIRLIKAGARYEIISKFFGVPISALWRFCSVNSIGRANLFHDSPMKEKMIKMLKDGELVSVIARDTGISYYLIKSAAKTYGYKYNKTYVPINSEVKNNILRLLRLNYSTTQIIEKLDLKNISSRVILILKKKYKIKGITRGGVSTVPPEEISYIKELMKKNTSINDIISKMNKKFNKMYSYETIRGRCRMYGYKRRVKREYDENERKIMVKALNSGISLGKIAPMFSDRSYNSIKRFREKIKHDMIEQKFKEEV